MIVSDPTTRNVRKCLRVAGSKPAYYYVEQLSWGDRYVVFFPDEPEEKQRELTRGEFEKSYVLAPPANNAKLWELFASFPDYRDRQDHEIHAI